MNGSDGEIASFGPFRLSPATREIEKDGVPLALGHRALDILIVLVEHAGEIVSHRELISRVWRGLVVDPGNLRVHMTALRRALDDGESGVRYIANVTGQGYCFVMPVTHTKSVPLSTPVKQSRALPPALARMIGRDDTVRTIAADLRADRFVTIVGPGGMGKTTVAISVGHAMLEEFDGKVCFVDIGAISDPALLATTVASTLGLTIQSEDVAPVLMEFLRTTRTLLVLDNCEHVIDAAASLAESIFSRAPQVHILATSREALRVEGEHAHWLRPLESPPPAPGLSAAQALTFPAVKLFVERAIASDSRFALTDANAPIVADICGRLDGLALALELVAGRIAIYGLEGTAKLLNKRLGLHWQGRRTALPRHQTLRALLDWSYSLLPNPERRVLRTLSIFVGTFTLEAAQAIAAAGDLDEAQVVNAVDHLAAKSLVSIVGTDDGVTSYRLLETTRVYAMGKLAESSDEETIAERHARYFVRLLSSTSGGKLEPCLQQRLPARREYLGSLRAALEWCFADRATSGGPRNASLGIDLAAAGAAAFLDFSLLKECHKWSTAALAVLDDSMRGDKRELVLQEARAISSMWTRGNGDDVRVAITRALEIAQNLGETFHRLRLLTGLHAYLIRINDLRGSLAVAEEMADVASTTPDVSCKVMADWLRGSSWHFLGDQSAAKQLFEDGFARGGARNAQQFGLDYRVRALVTFARVLWLNGYPDRAQQVAREALAEAAQTGKALDVCFSLLYTCPVFLWCGDLGTAEELIEKLMAHAHWQGWSAFHDEGLALKGDLLIRRGKAEDGIEVLRSALQGMKATRQNLLLALSACRLAEGLAAIGQVDEALEVIDDAVAGATRGIEALEFAELLRVRAIVLLAIPEADEAESERSLLQSLACARRQGALGWELRTTLTLARLRSTQWHNEEAYSLLSSLYDRFTEGFATSDLEAAAQLLQEFDPPADFRVAAHLADSVNRSID